MPDVLQTQTSPCGAGFVKQHGDIQGSLCSKGGASIAQAARQPTLLAIAQSDNRVLHLSRARPARRCADGAPCGYCHRIAHSTEQPSNTGHAFSTNLKGWAQPTCAASPTCSKEKLSPWHAFSTRDAHSRLTNRDTCHQPLKAPHLPLTAQVEGTPPRRQPGGAGSPNPPPVSVMP